MSAELSLVTQLAIILIAAGIFTIISKALKQPLILGYIVAGFPDSEFIFEEGDEVWLAGLKESIEWYK